MAEYNTEVISRFIDRVRQAGRSRSKQIHMPIEEAQDLTNALSLLLLREASLQNEIIRLQNAASTIEISMGGGTFR